jgi:hypothetical protein
VKLTKTQLREIIREQIHSPKSKSMRLKSILESWVLDEDGDTVKNPETGRNIKVSSALSYPKDHPAHKAALKRKSGGADVKSNEPESSKDWFDKNKLPIQKVKEIIPGADPDAFDGDSDVDNLSPKTRKKVSTRIDRIISATKEAKASGKPLPNINLCSASVPGTNLYCDGNKGIPRDKMPQFKGNPEPGSPADKLPRDKSGEVDTEPLYREHLKNKGIKTVPTKVPSDQLKATQGELDGSKVSGMTQALRENPDNPGIRAPIYVTKDGYVVDGHHRWAAMSSYAAENGKPVEMDVIVIDQDAEEAVESGNQFMEEIGIKPKSADPNKGKKESKLNSKKIVESKIMKLTNKQLREIIREELKTINENEIKVGSKVIVNYPTLKKPIMGIVKMVLKGPDGPLYILKNGEGVWDEKWVQLKN